MESLEALPLGVDKVSLRSDSAGYQHDLLRYCAEGKNERFGVIEFAIGAKVTDLFKGAVAEEWEWRPLCRDVERNLVETARNMRRNVLCSRRLPRRNIAPNTDFWLLEWPSVNRT
jgi:hypothetical protein